MMPATAPIPGPRASAGDRKLAWGATILGSLSILALLTPIYLGKKFYYHDSSLLMNPFVSLMESLLRGYWPFWAHEMNGGAPYWAAIEAYQTLLDPIAFAIGLPLAALGFDAHGIFAWIYLAWVVAFVFGGWRLARILRLPLWSAGTVAVLLTLSATLTITAEQLLFVNARYAPYILTELVAVSRGRSRGALFRASAWIAISLAGINTMYLFTFLFLFLLAAIVFGGRRSPRIGGGETVASLALLAAVYLPFIPTQQYISKETVQVSRLIASRGWWPNVLEHFQLGRVLSPFNTWHGAVFLGLPGAACLLLAFALRGGKAHARHVRRSAVFWGGFGLILFFLISEGFPRLFGAHRPFLSMRNWGDLIAYVNLSLAIGVGFAAVAVRKRLRSSSQEARFWLALGAISVWLLGVAATRSLLWIPDPPTVWSTGESRAFQPKLELKGVLGLIAALVALGGWGKARIGAALSRTRPSVFGRGFFALTLAAALVYGWLGPNVEVGHRWPESVQVKYARAWEGPLPAPPRREWDAPLADFAPVPQYGPQAFHREVASFPANLAPMDLWGVTIASMVYRPIRTDEILMGDFPDGVRRVALGTDADIARVLPCVVALPSRAKVADALRRASPLELRTLAWIESEESTKCESSDAPTGTASYQTLSSGSFEVSFHSSGQGWLVFGQTPEPGWRAWVNGTPARIYAANLVQMAIPVQESGRATLEYWPPAYGSAIVIRYAAAALAALWLSHCGLSGIWRKRRVRE